MAERRLAYNNKLIIVTNLQCGFDEKIIFSRLHSKNHLVNHEMTIKIHNLMCAYIGIWAVENYKILRSRDEINKCRSIVSFLKFSTVFDFL